MLITNQSQTRWYFTIFTLIAAVLGRIINNHGDYISFIWMLIFTGVLKMTLVSSPMRPRTSWSATLCQDAHRIGNVLRIPVKLACILYGDTCWWLIGDMAGTRNRVANDRRQCALLTPCVASDQENRPHAAASATCSALDNHSPCRRETDHQHVCDWKARLSNPTSHLAGKVD